MKALLALITVFIGFSATAENLCTDWQKSGSTCIIGAGLEGYGWNRNCDADPEVCQREAGHPDRDVCKATTICVGDKVNPNALETPCTEWQLGDSSYSCDNAREHKWARSCTWHNLETLACSVNQPED